MGAGPHNHGVEVRAGKRDESGALPEFLTETKAVRAGDWQVAPPASGLGLKSSQIWQWVHNSTVTADGNLA